MPDRSPSILLGVTGSIAAYKSLDLIRRLEGEGISVRVVATRNALPFFPVLPAEVFSGHPVETDLFNPRRPREEGGGRVSHLALLDKSDAVLVAPASADFIARMALGLADDLLSTLLLSATVPVLIAPAMEEAMYHHPASTGHRKTLLERGVVEIPPEAGPLASGKSGLGRMAPVDRILEALLPVLRTVRPPDGPLSGLSVLISTGPTREPIDAVRYIGNASSGRMGNALARAAQARGARVTLVSGPTDLPPPPGCDLHRVTTAREMQETLESLFPSHQLLIMAAAVSDYRMKDPVTGKRKKDGREWTLSLVENPDILKGLAARKRPGQFLVGFAAESSLDPSLLLEKCRHKKVDLLVANDISRADIGFSSPDNEVVLVTPSGEFRTLPRADKSAIAGQILDAVVAGGWPGHPAPFQENADGHSRP